MENMCARCLKPNKNENDNTINCGYCCSKCVVFFFLPLITSLYFLLLHSTICHLVACVLFFILQCVDESLKVIIIHLRSFFRLSSVVRYILTAKHSIMIEDSIMKAAVTSSKTFNIGQGLIYWSKLNAYSAFRNIFSFILFPFLSFSSCLPALKINENMNIHQQAQACYSTKLHRKRHFGLCTG